jgi:hypothetical protein
MPRGGLPIYAVQLSHAIKTMSLDARRHEDTTAERKVQSIKRADGGENRAEACYRCKFMEMDGGG